MYEYVLDTSASAGLDHQVPSRLLGISKWVQIVRSMVHQGSFEALIVQTSINQHPDY